MQTESIVLGGGCFWCLEALYQRVRGVIKVTSGYAGGNQENPSYDDLHQPGNSHAEVVKLEFDPAVISFETILEIFWTLHDPTTRNRQGNDVGVQYRSIILYSSEKQLKVINQTIETTAKQLWSQPLTTEIRPLETFWPAESYHQNYFNTHPEQAYCQIIINPKVTKLKKKFADLLSDN